jgi:hypothetical protein
VRNDRKLASVLRMCLALQVPDLDHVLPPTTLQTLKELTLDCIFSSLPEWPIAWRRLTVKCKSFLPLSPPDGPWYLYHSPHFLTELTGLKELEVSKDYFDFQDSEEEYLPSLAICLVLLTRLRIDLHYRTVNGYRLKGLKEKRVVKRLDDICQAVTHRVPRISEVHRS